MRPYGGLFGAIGENCQGTTDVHMNIHFQRGPIAIEESGDFAVPAFQIEDDISTRAEQALQGSTFVHDLRININSATLTGVRYISHFIAASPSISRLYILSDHGETWDRTSGSTAAVRIMLVAASVNSKIGTLSISPFVGAKYMAICLHGMKNSLVSLELNVLGLSTTVGTVQELTEEAEAMGLAVASLLALQELAISCHYDNITSFFLDKSGPVLPKLRKLMVSTHSNSHYSGIQANFIAAIQKCLIQSVHLETLYFDYEPNLMDLGQSISTLPLFRTVLKQVKHHPSIRVFRSNIVCEDEHIVHVVRLIESNTALLEEIQVSCANVPCVHRVVTALATNTVITVFEIDLCGKSVEDVDENIQKKHIVDNDTKRCIEYYTTRNTFTPALATASKADMLNIFCRLSNSSESTSVIFDTLRAKDNWYE